MNLPFEEKWISPNKSVRKFSFDLDDEELKWHTDLEDRIIECTHNTDWKFQFDNLLPQSLSEKIIIPSGTWHRLIRGTGDLEIIITRINTL
jgi:hypothetical protein